MEDEKHKISEDEWNSIQMHKRIEDRDIHIKEIDENLGMKNEYYVTNTKNGKSIYHMRSLNITPWLLSSLLLIGVTIICLSNLLSGEFNNDMPNFILFLVITVLFIIGDIWVIRNFIDVIRMRSKQNNSSKRSFLSKIFSVLFILFVIMIAFPLVIMFFMFFTNTIPDIKTIVANIEKYIKIYAIIVFSIGFLAFIIQAILAIDGWKKHINNRYNSKQNDN